MPEEHEQGGVDTEPSAVEDNPQEIQEHQPEEQSQQDIDRELLASLFGEDVVDNALSNGEETESNAEEPAGEPEEESPQAEEETEDQPPSARLKPRRLRQIENQAAQTQQSAPPPQPGDPGEPENDWFIESLEGDLKREYELAVAAETHLPDRFKGAAQKMEKYLRLLARKHEAGELPDPDDPDFEEKMSALRDRHAPKISNEDRIEIRAAAVAESRLKEVGSQTQKRLEEYEAKIRRLETAPLIEKAVDEFRKELVDSSEGAFDPEEINEIEGMGYEEAWAERGREVLPYVKAMILARAFSEVCADKTVLQKNPQKAHDDVMRIAVEASHRFQKEADKSDLERNGRTFLPFDDYHRHRANLVQKFGSEREADVEMSRRHFTFGRNEIFKAIADDAAREKKAWDDRMRKRYGGASSSAKQDSSKNSGSDLKPTPPKQGVSRVPSSSSNSSGREKVTDPILASLVGTTIPARPE